ncbi:MAG: hypothetical protein H7138_17415, partial [Myxococcales bacterium]|nr:hypothetical protein [Myxococcales bacterium]
MVAGIGAHVVELANAKTFGDWCVKQGWIATNPLAEIECVGQRNRGKKQLRLDEARRLVDLCLRKANEGDEAAVDRRAAQENQARGRRSQRGTWCAATRWASKRRRR